MGKGKGTHCYPCRISEVGMSAEKGMQMSKHCHTMLSISDCTSCIMPVFTGLSSGYFLFSTLGILFLYYTAGACDQFHIKVVI